MLDGSNSSDPDGDALSFSWAWAIGDAVYLTNGVSPTIELPAGTHTIQLMVSDGRVSSLPDKVNIAVVAPPPLLYIACSGTNAVLSWSTNGAAFHLQATTNPASAAFWSDVPDAPIILSNQFIVTDPLQSKRFYRLRNP